MDFKSKIKLPEVTSLPTPSSDTEGDVVKKGDSVYICRAGRWRKIYPPVSYGVDVPRLCGLRPNYMMVPVGTSITNVIFPGMQACFVPFISPYGAIVTAISISVYTPLSGGVAEVAIYDSELRNLSSGGSYYPNNRLIWGTVPVDTTGIKTLNFSSTPLELLAGELYFCALCNPQSGSFSLYCLTNSAYNNPYIHFNGGTVRAIPKISATSLPNPAPSSGYSFFTAIPVFWLTLSDVFLF